jgi:hypothetical protein
VREKKAGERSDREREGNGIVVLTWGRLQERMGEWGSTGAKKGSRGLGSWRGRARLKRPDCPQCCEGERASACQCERNESEAVKEREGGTVRGREGGREREKQKKKEEEEEKKSERAAGGWEKRETETCSRETEQRNWGQGSNFGNNYWIMTIDIILILK